MRARLSARVGAALAAVSLIAACGGGAATPSPSAQPSVTQRPTASPEPEVDIAAAVMEALADPAFRTTASVGGQFQFGTITFEVSGEMRISGEDHHLVITVVGAGLPAQTSETIQLDGRTYERQGDGLWMLQPDADSDSGTVVAGFDFTSLREAGTTEVEEETLVRLMPVGGSPPDASFFGVNDPSVEDFSGEVELLATRDGVPAGIVVTGSWRQLLSGEMVEATAEMTFLFEGVGQWVAIRAPHEAWVRYTSDELTYAIAHPQGWEVTHQPAEDDQIAFDVILGPIDGEVHVVRYDDVDPSMPRNAWYQESAAILEDDFGMKISTWEEATVAGQPAAIFRLHYTDRGTEYFFQQMTMLSDGVGWDINWFSRTGGEEHDRVTFLDFLGTFAPGG